MLMHAHRPVQQPRQLSRHGRVRMRRHLLWHFLHDAGDTRCNHVVGGGRWHTRYRLPQWRGQHHRGLARHQGDVPVVGHHHRPLRVRRQRRHRLQQRWRHRPWRRPRLPALRSAVRHPGDHEAVLHRHVGVKQCRLRHLDLQPNHEFMGSRPRGQLLGQRGHRRRLPLLSLRRAKGGKGDADCSRCSRHLCPGRHPRQAQRGGHRGHCPLHPQRHRHRGSRRLVLRPAQTRHRVHKGQRHPVHRWPGVTWLGGIGALGDGGGHVCGPAARRRHVAQHTGHRHTEGLAGARDRARANDAP
mmetsp:Transcript_3430/g.7377  ORF Transcript_3430/g.7377 Transcript_3430/m.7377 type:complete len:299 (+) Transcript_3430:1448-2344(+)